MGDLSDKGRVWGKLLKGVTFPRRGRVEEKIVERVAVPYSVQW